MRILLLFSFLVLLTFELTPIGDLTSKRSMCVNADLTLKTGLRQTLINVLTLVCTKGIMTSKTRLAGGGLTFIYVDTLIVFCFVVSFGAVTVERTNGIGAL